MPGFGPLRPLFGLHWASKGPRHTGPAVATTATCERSGLGVASRSPRPSPPRGERVGVRGPCPRADALGYFLSALRAFTRPAKICCGLACLAGRDQPIPSVELRQRWPRGTGSLPKPVPITFVGIHRRPAREHKSTARTAVLRPIFSPFLPISFYCLQLECAEVESCS